MKKILRIFLVITFILPLLTLAQKNTPEDLPPKYRKWIEEEVVYIITPKEKDVFLQLNTDRERDLFIKAFWRIRNPNPFSETNEFKEEHYKRIEYANRQFGRTSSLPGWKTDRGRIYITLGPPTSKQFYENLSSIYPVIAWYYQGMSKYGLTDVFNIVFYKRMGTGDYILYSPNIDGPTSLVAHYSLGQETMTFESAYKELYEADTTLADVAISLVPGETFALGEFSLASDRLLMDINSLPEKIVKDEYSEKFLRFKDIVEVEYTANYIGNQSLVHVSQDEAGIFFVNYIVELDRFSVNQFDDKFVTRLKANGKVDDSEGRTILQFERSIPIQLNQNQFKQIQSQKAGIQDLFPLIEGDFHFTLLVKNEASKEFTSVERDITIPSSSEVQMSTLVLAYNRKQGTPPNRKSAFRIGKEQLFPVMDLNFSQSDTLTLFCQIFGGRDIKNKSIVKIEIFKDETEVQAVQIEKIKNLEDYRFNTVLEDFTLSDLAPGYYKIRVSVQDDTGQILLSREKPFLISPVSGLPRPWINSIIHLPIHDPSYLMQIGNQLMNKEDFAQAKLLLEKAYKKNPSSHRIAFSLSRALFQLKEYKTIIDILTPFLPEKKPEIYELLAKSFHVTGQFQKAISLYKEYITHFGENFYILSFLGDCYYRLGNMQEALRLWERSLKMNPNQEELKKLVNSIKEKKD